MCRTRELLFRDPEYSGFYLMTDAWEVKYELIPVVPPQSNPPPLFLILNGGAKCGGSAEGSLSGRARFAGSMVKRFG